MTDSMDKYIVCNLTVFVLLHWRIHTLDKLYRVIYMHHKRIFQSVHEAPTLCCHVYTTNSFTDYYNK